MTSFHLIICSLNDRPVYKNRAKIHFFPSDIYGMRDHDVSHVYLSAVPPEDLTSHDNYMISCKLSDSRFIGQVTTNSCEAYGILALQKKAT